MKLAVVSACSSAALTAVDHELSDFWMQGADNAIERETEEGAGGMVVRAALSAVPYLVRRERWQVVAEALGRAVGVARRRCSSPARPSSTAAEPVWDRGPSSPPK